jgi:hypothetical protein
MKKRLSSRSFLLGVPKSLPVVFSILLVSVLFTYCEKRTKSSTSTKTTLTTGSSSTSNERIYTGRVYNIANNKGVEGATVLGIAYADADWAVTDHTGTYSLHLNEAPLSVSVSVLTKPGEVYFFTRGNYYSYTAGDTGFNFDCYPTVAYSAFFAKKRSDMRLFSKSKVSDIAGSNDPVAPFTFSVPVVVGITNTISYTGISGMLNKKEIVPTGPIQDTVYY